MQQLNKKVQKKGCEIFSAPYNAHPLTHDESTQNAVTSQQAQRSQRENLKR